MKTILIFGGTGFIGSRLVNELKPDYKLIVFTRNPVKDTSSSNNSVIYQTYNPTQAKQLTPWFEKAFGVINLTGQNIGDKRWSENFRDQILQSRLLMGNLIKEAFDQSKNKPSFFIQGSATHYYGINPSDAKITEDRPSTRDCFLTMVSLQTEENVERLDEQTRLVFARTGIVLDKTEGAFSKMAMPVKAFVGGPLGNGNQWVPWIHINDEIKAIRFIIENEEIKGGVNLTAPNPVRQKDFAKAIGKKLHRPAFLPAPAFALRLILGKTRANDLLLSGLRIIPKKLTDAGFKFQFDKVADAISDIYK